jgi:hypothetical protein
VPNWGAMFDGHGGGRTNLHRNGARGMQWHVILTIFMMQT